MDHVQLRVDLACCSETVLDVTALDACDGACFELNLGMNVAASRLIVRRTEHTQRLCQTDRVGIWKCVL